MSNACAKEVVLSCLWSDVGMAVYTRRKEKGLSTFVSVVLGCPNTQTAPKFVFSHKRNVSNVITLQLLQAGHSTENVWTCLIRL